MEGLEGGESGVRTRVNRVDQKSIGVGKSREAGPGGAAAAQAGDAAEKAGGKGCGGEGVCVPPYSPPPAFQVFVSGLGRDRLPGQSEPRAGLRAANNAAGEELGRGLAGQGRGLGASKGSRAATREPWRWGCSAQGTGVRGQK